MRRRSASQVAAQRQLCAVIGYQPASRAQQRGLVLHLACGAAPECRLRYTGRLEVRERSIRFAREIVRVLRTLRTPVHPPGVQSPMPGNMHRVIPSVLVEVEHAGWTAAGLLIGPRLVAFHSPTETSRQAHAQ